LKLDTLIPAAVVAEGGEGLRAARDSIRLGLFSIIWSTLFGIIYWAFGSPLSGLACAAITLSVLVSPIALFYRIPVAKTYLALTLVSALGTSFVMYRTGGILSPAVFWAFFHPLVSYFAYGVRAAAFAGVLCGAQLMVFYLGHALGWHTPQDLSLRAADGLRVAALFTSLGSVPAAIAAAERMRKAALRLLAESHRAAERERILADLHDGIGSQLLGLLVHARAKTLDATRLQQQLESCMDDLRLVVEGLDSSGSYEAALGELRARLEPRCAAAGIALGWSVDVSAIQASAAERVLQVVRILQEALTNALRHSRAARIDVSVIASAGALAIEVRDDGAGFDPLSIKRGRGLGSMRARAKQLDGELVIAPAQPGTRLSLRLSP
jgi:signal transduction histidine kinase